MDLSRSRAVNKNPSRNWRARSDSTKQWSQLVNDNAAGKLQKHVASTMYMSDATIIVVRVRQDRAGSRGCDVFLCGQLLSKRKRTYPENLAKRLATLGLILCQLRYFLHLRLRSNYRNIKVPIRFDVLYWVPQRFQNQLTLPYFPILTYEYIAVYLNIC